MDKKKHLIGLLNIYLIVSFEHIAPDWTCYESLTVRKKLEDTEENRKVNSVKNNVYLYCGAEGTAPTQ